MTGSGMDDLITTAEGGVATLTLDRPHAGNALTQELGTAIAAGVKDALAAGARCIVLAASGRVFCSGADLGMLEAFGSPPSAADVRDRVYSSFQGAIAALSSAPVPVVARMQGPALGAGADLALACDMRVASTDAWVEESWIKLGTISALGGAFALSRLLGSGNALDAMLTARRLDAAECHARGIFQRVVAPERLDEELGEMTGQIAARDPDAVRAMKRLVRGDAELETLPVALGRALEEQVPLVAREAFAERVRHLRAAIAGSAKRSGSG